MPNNLKEPTRSMVPEDVASGGKFSLVSGSIIIYLVLVLLTSMSVVQVSNSSRNWIILGACELGGSSPERVESLTYLSMEQPADRSLMRRRNDNGPNQEPWGIPPVSGFQEDKHWLAWTLCWCLLDTSQTTEVGCWVWRTSSIYGRAHYGRPNQTRFESLQRPNGQRLHYHAYHHRYEWRL